MARITLFRNGFGIDNSALCANVARSEIIVRLLIYA
jgi:hypothetical protein